MNDSIKWYYYHTHFKDEETEALKMKDLSKFLWPELGCELGQAASRSHDLSHGLCHLMASILNSAQGEQP